jgi:hypothetical protein
VARKIVFLTIATVFCLGIASSVWTRSTSAVTAADWRAGRIIDDGVFIDKDSMSVAQIQAFLNSKVGTGGNGVPGQCDTNGTRTSELGGGTRAQYGAAHNNPVPFTCLKDYYEVPKLTPGPGVPASNYGGASIPAGAKSAAQLIWDAAQRNYISPKVLLITIQKESVGPLITDDWPFKSQYTYAMGAHCPDSGPGGSANCDPNYSGFSIQISESAALFRYYLDNMTQPWWPYKKLGVNSIQYNPSVSCGSSNVNIETSATAALYTYTPYQPNQAALNNMYGTGDGCSAYGNRNFWRMYNDWFGSTQFSQPIGAYLYYQESTGRVFLVTTDNNTRYFVPSWSMLQNYRLDRFRIVSVPDSTLQQYTDGGSLTSLVWDAGGVFLVNDGTKYHVPTAQTCTDWALACFDNSVTKQLGSSFQDSYLVGGTELANLAAYRGVYYKMQSGQRLPIADSNTLSSLGFTPNMALFFTDTNVTQPLGGLLLSTPTGIKFNGSATVYYFDGSTYHKFPDAGTASAWGINSPLIPPASAYDSTPPTTGADMGRWYQAAGNKYLIDQGRKVLLDTNQQQLWPLAAYQTFATTLANSLPSINLSSFVWSTPNVYLISSDGQKHYVPSYDDYVSLGINSQNTTSISPDVMSSVTQGADAFGAGKLVGISGTSKIYVVSFHKLVHITDPGTFNAFGFDWSKIASYPSSILTDYPEDGVLTATLSYDGNFNFVIGSQRLKMSLPMAIDYGLKTNQFKSIEKPVSSRLNNGQAVNRFLYNQDDGKIYYASGGALHYVSSYQAFVAYGGLIIPATPVNALFIGNFTVAQPV